MITVTAVMDEDNDEAEGSEWLNTFSTLWEAGSSKAKYKIKVQNDNINARSPRLDCIFTHRSFSLCCVRMGVK